MNKNNINDHRINDDYNSHHIPAGPYYILNNTEGRASANYLTKVEKAKKYFEVKMFNKVNKKYIYFTIKEKNINDKNHFYCRLYILVAS